MLDRPTFSARVLFKSKKLNLTIYSKLTSTLCTPPGKLLSSMGRCAINCIELMNIQNARIGPQLRIDRKRKKKMRLTIMPAR